MFGIGFPELLLVLVVILIVFGPDKLPEAAKRLGKITGSLRKTSDALRREFYNAVYEPTEEIRGEARNAMRELRSLETDLQTTLSRLQSIPDEMKTCEEKELEASTRQKLEEQEKQNAQSTGDATKNPDPKESPASSASEDSSNPDS